MSPSRIPTLQGDPPQYARDRKTHAAVYTELHEGRSPDRFVATRVSKAYAGKQLGRMTEILYRKRTLERGAHRYWHPYAEHARPIIANDAGKLAVYSGKYVVTTHGIEDLPESHQRRERPPPLPRQLTDLGTLEWIKYEDGDGTIRQLDFPLRGAPTIAHDEQGNLHVVGGNVALKTVSSLQGEGSMYYNPRRRHRRRHPRHSHARRGFHRFHRNPEESRKEAKSAIMEAVIVGSIAAATIVGLDVLFRYVSFLNTQSSTVKNLIRIAVGVGGAYAFRDKAPAVASGIGVGGIFDGAIGFWQGMNGESYMELNSPGSPYAPGQPAASAPPLGAQS